jgi:hypothetical protein
MKRTDQISRREALIGIVSAGVVGMAGCSGDDGDSNAPDSDANPRDLLPEAPEGWTTTTAANQQAASMIGAEAGFQRAFDDPDGVHYVVEFYRFPSKGDAEETADFYSDWTAYVVRGNFGFAGNGPDVDKVYLMMENSPALTEEYVRDNDMS